MSTKDGTQSVKGVHLLRWPLLGASGLAWVHPVTFLHIDDVVRPEEGVIDLDWHKQPVPCLACHTASLGHCSMPECQMRKGGEHTQGADPLMMMQATVLGEAWTHSDKKDRFDNKAPRQREEKATGMSHRNRNNSSVVYDSYWVICRMYMSECAVLKKMFY